MQCEMCGKSIRGTAHLVIVEGTELNVCDECARYGHEVKRVPKSTTTAMPPPGRGGGGISIRTQPKRRRPDMFDQMTDELVDDYGSVIRRARDKRGMSQEELALEIREKVSLLKKIEREDLVPEDSARKKLERVLGITLTERIE